MRQAKPKLKTCPICRELFQPWRTLQPTCNAIACMTEFALTHIEKKKAKEAKADRANTRAALEKLKTLPQLKKEAQDAFNKFIRQRDESMPCICCGKPLKASEVGGAFDAGHYRSIGSAPHLRFNEHNCHGQRKACNRHGAGRAVDYRLGLITRIGLEAVVALECDNTPRHYTKDDLRAIKAEYKQKLKGLKNVS